MAVQDKRNSKEINFAHPQGIKDHAYKSLNGHL